MVNDNSNIVNKLETSLIGDARVVIYDRHMFTVQATECDAFSVSKMSKWTAKTRV